MIFPVRRASDLETQAEERRWLVEQLWGEESVGIIGGEPKCCKSFMALSLGVAVASGTPCLGRFAVASRGPVLLYPAEDALPTVRRRLEGICAAGGIDFHRLPLYVITASRLQLDVQSDRERLRETIEKLQPRLLILDPFVRLHGIDENASGEVASLLQFLRHLQRTYRLCVAVVHHARKGGSAKRPGQALRGSSDFHAWGDSNLYLSRRDSDQITLTVEHRADQPPDPIGLELRTDGDAAHLEIAADETPAADRPSASPERQILDLLAAAGQPLRIRSIRDLVGLRHETVSSLVGRLAAQGTIQKTADGYRLP